MRIAVVNNWVPFLRGGAEHLAEALPRKFREYGHRAILIRLPFCWQPPSKVIDHIVAARCVRLDDVDRMIGLKFPAYYVPHPNKVLWLLHQFRQVYDLWHTPEQDLPDTPEVRQVRDVVFQSDRRFLPEYRKIYTNSHVTGDRLKRFNDIDSEVLFPPLLETALFRCELYGDAVFCPSRITLSKRQHLLVEAMAHTRTPVRLVIAGGPETQADVARLEEIVEEHGLNRRVTLLPRFISEDEKASLMAAALACAYLPYDEDSYGYVTLEAYHSRKAMITCTDAGGILILVKHGETGLVVPPEPKALGAAMDQLYSDRQLARRLGESGYDAMLGLNITWENVIQKLTS